MGVRPEYVDWSPSSRPDAIPAEVTVVENLGATALVVGRVGDERIQAVVPEERVPAIGEHCWFSVPAAKTLLFDAQTTQRIAGGDR